MSMMQKLMEINDEAVRLRTECEQLRSDQKTLQEICAAGRQRITELQADLRKACAERDEAVEHAGRLQAELDATRKQLQELCTKPAEPQPVKVQGGGLLRDVSHYTEAAEVDTPVADDAPTEPVKVREGRWKTRNGEIRNVTRTPHDLSDEGRYSWHDAEHCQTWHDNGRYFHEKESPFDLVAYLGPIEPENSGFEGHILREQPQPVQEVTLSAYVVGDTVSPGALRIVWATEEWIEQSKFGIVHAMKDVMFLDHDRFTDPEQFSLHLYLKKQ